MLYGPYCNLADANRYCLLPSSLPLLSFNRLANAALGALEAADGL